MIATRSDGGRKCERCGRLVLPRGALPPRYCAICGHRLVPLHDEVQRALAPQPRVAASAVLALVLGLLGIAPHCFPAALAAVFIGVVAKGRIRNSGGALVGCGLATAGIILGLIAVALALVVHMH